MGGTLQERWRICRFQERHQGTSKSILRCDGGCAKGERPIPSHATGKARREHGHKTPDRRSETTSPSVERGCFVFGGGHACGSGRWRGVCFSNRMPRNVTLKFEVVKDARIDSPRFFTGRESSSRMEDHRRGYFVTTGISPDLLEASRLATREMISYLSKEYDLKREEAYILCSVAGDLRIHEVVDAPNWVVGLAISKSVLGLS